MQQVDVILPVFTLIAIGYVMRRYVMKASWTPPLNGFVYYVALPALIITAISGIDMNSDGFYNLIWFNIAALLASALCIYLITSLLTCSARTKAAFFMMCLVGNSVYMGIPLVARAINNDDYANVIALSAVINLVGGMLISLLAIEFIYLKSKNHRKVARDFIVNPLFLSLFAGIVLLLLDTPVLYEKVLDSPLTMLSVTASPLALFTLGAFLYGHAHIKNTLLSLFAVIIKLTVMPVIVLVISNSLVAGVYQQDTLLLISAMPTAVTVFVIAQKYKLDQTFVANGILIGTVLSVITTSFWLLFV